MSKVMTIKISQAFALAIVAVVGILAVGPSRADDIDDTLLRLNGEFEIGEGDVKVISRRHHPATVRVCVNPADHSVPLKVTFDKHEEFIPPGKCSDVSGARISLAAGARLDPEYVLIGKWTRLGA